MPVHFSDGTNILLTFKGKGIMADDDDDKSASVSEHGKSSIPTKSLVALPGQVSTCNGVVPDCRSRPSCMCGLSLAC